MTEPVRTPDVLQLGPTAEVVLHLAAVASTVAAPPPSLGTCPLRWGEGADQGVVFAETPRERAVWLSLRSSEPIALGVVVDGVDAVTGRPADERGALGHGVLGHVVLPAQRWLDGVRSGDDRASQLLAPGPGDRVELRLVAHRLRGARWREWWADSGARRRCNRFGEHELEMVRGGADGASAVAGDGASHSEVPQRIEPDPFGDDAWDPEPFVVQTVLLVPEGDVPSRRSDP